MSKTIIFFGTDDFSAISLRELLVKGFSISAVVTKPDSRKGRGRTLEKPLVKQIAEEHNIAVLQPTKVVEIEEPIRELTKQTGEKPIGVLVSYGKIIPQSTIDLFSPGIINVHPSLLPKYRGPSPIEAAILAGDTETGVTIMQLSAAMDAGSIYTQVTVPLTDTETGPQLEQLLGELGAQELCVMLPGIMNGSRTPTPQDESSATYCKLIAKEDGLPNPLELTAEQLERRIRAYRAYPKTKLAIGSDLLVVTKAHIKPLHTTETVPVADAQARTSAPATLLEITCKDNQKLVIDELVGPSGKTVSAQAFLNGYRNK